jgi:hypothetical protein
MVQAGYVPGRPLGTGMPSWTSGCSCLRGGGPTCRPPAVPGATSPRHCRCSANRSEPPPCCRPWRRRGSCRSRTLSPIASRGIVRIFWTPSMRVWALQPGWRLLQSRAAGSSARRRRTGARRIRGKPARSGWALAPSTPHVPWRLWRRTCPPPAGISARSRKGPRGPWCRLLPANACPSGRRDCPSGRSGWGSSGPWGRTRCMPTRSVMHRRARPCGPLSGSVAYAGRSSHAVQKAKRSAGWPMMQCAHIPAGTTIC